LPSSVRHRVPQHNSYSIAASHTFTQNHCCFHDRAISCGLTRVTTEKIGLDSQQQKGNISVGCIQKTPFLLGNLASVNLTLAARDKIQEFLLQNTLKNQMGLFCVVHSPLATRRGFSRVIQAPSIISGVWTVLCLSNCTSTKVYFPFFPKLPINATIFFSAGIRRLGNKPRYRIRSANSLPNEHLSKMCVSDTSADHV